MLFDILSSLPDRETTEFRLLQERLIIIHVRETCISLHLNKYLNSLTTLQHLTIYLMHQLFKM